MSFRRGARRVNRSSTHVRRVMACTVWVCPPPMARLNNVKCSTDGLVCLVFFEMLGGCMDVTRNGAHRYDDECV